MTLPRTATVVLYPDGTTTATASVLHAEPVVGGAVGSGPDGSEGTESIAVLLDRTPVHPVDTAWPDQGPDRATLRAGDDAWELLGCVVAATDGSALYLGDDIPVKKGTEGWAFVVAHLLPADALLGSDEVIVEVDADHRRVLSVGHSACHLVSLALNRALAGAWRKDVADDALGAPDFDAVACESSTIRECGSVDSYRVGRSVRRAGFDPEALEDLGAIETAINMSLEAWTSADSPIRIEREGETLTDRRFWVCSTPEGIARIPCGGTHASSTSELAGVTARITARDTEGARGFIMETVVP